jgi:hypothetical protein
LRALLSFITDSGHSDVSPTPVPVCGFLRTEPLEIAAALWRRVEASNKR